MYVFIRLKVKDTPESNVELVGQFLQRAETIVRLGMEATTDRPTFDPADIQVSAIPHVNPAPWLEIFRKRHGL